MASFTARKLKEIRNRLGLLQDEVAKKMNISKRNLQRIESGEISVNVEEIVAFAKLYKVDVRELIYESYVDEEEERILFDRYAAVFRVYNKLSDRNKEEVYRILKDYVRRMD